MIFLDSTANPATLYPGTTWSKIENRFLYASSSPGKTGGRSSVSLLLANIPSHDHPASQGAHNHTANHNHGASQAAHVHTQVDHTHIYTTLARKGGQGFRTDANNGGTAVTSAAGGENTGSAQPTITITTANVTTSNATPGITIGKVGSGTAFDIMPPYYTVCVWKRLS